MVKNIHWQRPWNFLTLVIVVATLFAIFLYNFRRPQYDWDMLPYMVIALMDTGKSFESAHSEVYEAIRSGAPAATYDALTDKFPVSDPKYSSDRVYRANSFLYPDKFREALPYYTIKPIFPMLVAGLRMAGVNLLRAPAILAGMGYLLSCLLIFFWISGWMAVPIAGIITVAMSLTPQLAAVSILTTPDSLSLFVVLLGAYLIVERGSLSTGLSVLMVAITIRPEVIIYFIGFALYFGALDRRQFQSFALVIVGLILYKIITLGGYSWSTLFYFTLVDRSIGLPQFVSPLGILDYLRIYRQELTAQVFDPMAALAVFILVAFGALVMKVRAGNFRDRYFHLVCLVFILAGCRMIILPTSFYRALLPCYILATIAFIQACAVSEASFERTVVQPSPIPDA
jgi:hypothetical protein